MKLVIQRVKEASVVRVGDSKTVGSIGRGLFILIGVGKGDKLETAKMFAEKVFKLRIMSDENGKMNLSIKDLNLPVLAVSQFTLYANTKDGNRPSFIEAEGPDKALKIYNQFVKSLRKFGCSVETGSFGDYMVINSVLDGPVTILV